MEFATLTCKRDLEMALGCLKSFLDNVEGVAKLRVFDDGSLGEADLERFLALDNRFEVVPYARRTPEVLELLSERPNAMRLRGEHPLNQKLLDVCLLSGDPVHFIDSDVLFIRKLRMADLAGRDAFLLRDDDHGYSGRLLDLLNFFGQMPCWGNTGFFRLPRERYDLDLIDALADRPELRTFAGLVEQTVLSKFLSNGACVYISDRQIPCSRSQRDFWAARMVAVHFMAEKHLYEEHAPRANTQEEAVFETLPLEYLTRWKILRRRLQRAVAPWARIDSIH